MTFYLFKFGVDISLAILGWVVQLAVYPSFKFFEEENLKKWHKKYTHNISILAAPLMIAQLGLSIWWVIKEGHWVSIASLGISILTWINTFAWAVPLHKKIDTESSLKETLDQLTRANIPRTILWTALVIIDLLFITTVWIIANSYG